MVSIVSGGAMDDKVRGCLPLVVLGAMVMAAVITAVVVVIMGGGGRGRRCRLCCGWWWLVLSAVGCGRSEVLTIDDTGGGGD